MAKAKDTDLERYNDDSWAKRRGAHAKLKELYDGVPLRATQPRLNRESGEPIKRFPLQLNTAGLACDIHADITRGLPMDDDPLVVRTVIERSDNMSSERAIQLEKLLNDGVWRSSAGGPDQWQAFLHMNIYGETAFRIVWEPWDTDLPYGLGVRFIREPSFIHPTFDPQNPWRMLECYFGYMISPKIAKLKYNVEPSSDRQDALYLEYWSPTEWWVHVDGQIPTMTDGETEWELAGQNTFGGVVPFYYVPHRRTTGLFGDSQIADQQDLMEEFNSRAVSISDLVRDIKGNIVVTTDVKKLEMSQIMLEGQVIRHRMDLGSSSTMPGGGAKPPSAEPLGIPDVPDAITGWPNTLLDYWMMFNRISPAAFGTDDTKSGRITGPAVSQRMWSTTSHAATARANFSRVKTMIDKDLLKIMSLKGTISQMAKHRPGINTPAVGKLDLLAQMRQQWPMMLPLDRQELLKGLVELYREGAISVELLLNEWGREDVEEERAMNLKWRYDVLEQEKELAPEPAFGGGGDAS